MCGGWDMQDNTLPRSQDLPSTIRQAEPGDAAELARLRWVFRPQDQAGRSLFEFTQHFCAWFQEALASQQWIIAVAEAKEGSLYGCMYLQCIAKVPVPGEIRRAWGYVTNSYVEPNHRSQGIGRRLLELLIGVAQSRELEFLIVWPSERAVPFYQRAGFRPADQAHAGPDDEPPLELVL
jgi:GNAT superfamily N-acetyltransferase